MDYFISLFIKNIFLIACYKRKFFGQITMHIKLQFIEIVTSYYLRLYNRL